MPLTKEQANAIYTVLVECAGAYDDQQSRDQFVYVESETDCIEYRFMGALGYGGKFYISYRGHWSVNCYQEDMNDERFFLIEVTNLELADLHAQLN